MNKKFILIIVLILNFVIVLLSIGHLLYHPPAKVLVDGWRKVVITDVATIQIPETWIYSTDEKKMLFTDKYLDEENFRIYIYGVRLDSMEEKDFSVADMAVSYIQTLSEEKIKGTDVLLGVDTLTIDGIQRDVAYLLFRGNQPVKLYCIAPEISKDFLVEIAKNSGYTYVNATLESMIRICAVVILGLDIFLFFYIKRKYPYEISRQKTKVKD